MAQQPPTGRSGGWWHRIWAAGPLTPEEVQLERQLGWGRLVGAVSVLASRWQYPPEGLGWVSGLMLASGVGLLVAWLVTRLAARQLPTSRRLTQALGLADAVLISMLIPYGATLESPYLLLIFGILAILGALRHGRLGVLRNLIIAAPFETVRLVAGQALADNQSIVDTGIAILLASALGILVGDRSVAAREAARTVRAQRAVAERDGIRMRRLSWELRVVNDIVEVAGTGAVGPALEAAVRRIHEHLDVVSVDLLTVGGSDGLVVTATTDPDVRVGSVLPILPGGPRDRALSLGTVAAATHDDLEALAAASGRDRGSIVAAPLPVGDRVLGVLVCESAGGDLLHRRDAALVGRLGRCLAPFVAVAIDQATADQAPGSLSQR